jgi:ferredoxin-type protein NapH
LAKRGDNRTRFQLAWAALTNGYALGYVQGRIFSGWSKSICLPGLNCYSCPGALGACPIGSLQAVLGGRGTYFSFYVVGFLLCVGSVFGRFICGWACPFGMLQDLIYRIPLPKKWKHKNLPGHRRLKWVKYVMLLLFVILAPMLLVDKYGLGSPYFCKWICPAGTVAGGLLLSANEPLRQLIGSLFLWKIALALVVLALALVYYRPFCKYLCPLGAFYAPFNRVALMRYQVDEHACTHCGACERACKMGIDPIKNPNSPECIRCGDCVRICPLHAIARVNIRQSTGGNVRADRH